jgi:putative hydrolase of HD superfamily
MKVHVPARIWSDKGHDRDEIEIVIKRDVVPMKSIANFLFETGMLKRIQRSGYPFLGSGKESVAEHSFRTTIIGYVLSQADPSVDSHRILLMCLMHDLPEARTGDLNYVNKRYVTADEEKALVDCASDLPFGGEIIDLIREFNEGKTPESRIARDADQLDLILELKEQLDLGNKYAPEWLHFAVQRVQTETAKEMLEAILDTDRTDWWFEKRTELWVKAISGEKGGEE